MSTVLVTGGSGFLGSSVVPSLVTAGHRVFSGDLRVPDATPDDVTCLAMDVTDRALVHEVIGEVRPEVIVHLASIVTPGADSSRELEYTVDVLGTRHVLDAAVEYGVRRIVVTSSGAAYGYHPDNGAAHRGWLHEDDPLRGNAEFAYSHHKRLVEQILTEYPGLEQVILRPGTILGAGVDNQITALFDRPRLLKIAGSDSPFVFIWDTDMAQIVVQAVDGDVTGAFNVAGDGALTIGEIADRLGKQTVSVPEPVLRRVLAVAQRFGLTRYGPEQTRFLQYRPVLANEKLKTVFGYTPRYSSAQAFDAWLAAREHRDSP